MRCKTAHPYNAPARHRALSCLDGNASAVSRVRWDRWRRQPSMATLSQHLLDFADGLGGIEVLRACLGAIHDGMAAVQPKGVLEIIEALAGRLIAAVDDPSICRQQRRGSKVTIAVPPIAGAARGTASAQDAGRGPIDLFLVFLRLQ